jgi:hypothetical protein
VIRTEDKDVVGPPPSHGHRRLPGDQPRPQLRFQDATTLGLRFGWRCRTAMLA